MNTIIISREPVNQIPTLDEVDKLYCDRVFANYQLHFRFINGLLNNLDVQSKSRCDSLTDTVLFSTELDSVSQSVKDIRATASKLTTALVDYIERYHKLQYSIEFNSYEIKKTESAIELASYQPVLDNITSQVGPDLLLAGKSKISNEFKALFRWPEYQPVLKGDKISFPSFGSYDHDSWSEKYSLSHTNKDVEKLLSVLSLYFLDRTKVPEGFQNQIIAWHREVSFSIYYLLLGELDVSVKFYKNRRVDLICKDAKTAGDFWSRFDLENIAARYREANPK